MKYIITESQLRLLESSKILLYNELTELNGKTVKFTYICDDTKHQEKMIVRILKIEHRVWKREKTGQIDDNILATFENVLTNTDPFRLRFVMDDKPYFEDINDDCYYVNEKLSDFILNYLENRPTFEPDNIETDF
jgi:hypothetical protein